MKNQTTKLETKIKYGQPPFQIELLHGGPGASGEMKPVAEELSSEYGIIKVDTNRKINLIG